jgi:hypothetical protein
VAAPVRGIAIEEKMDVRPLLGTAIAAVAVLIAAALVAAVLCWLR